MYAPLLNRCRNSGNSMTRYNATDRVSPDSDVGAGLTQVRLGGPARHVQGCGGTQSCCAPTVKFLLVVGPGARRLETRRAAACLPSPAAWPAGLPAHGLDTRICIPRDWCEAQSLVRPLPAWYVTSQQAGAPHSTARRAGVALGARRVTAPGHRALGGALQLALVASALRPEPGSLGSHSEG